MKLLENGIEIVEWSDDSITLRHTSGRRDRDQHFNRVAVYLRRKDRRRVVVDRDGDIMTITLRDGQDAATYLTYIGEVPLKP